MPRIKFNPEINLGHLAQLIGGLGVLFGLYYSMNTRVALLEAQSNAHSGQITKLVETVDQNSKSIVRLVTQQEHSRN